MELSINGAKYLAEFELPLLGTVHLTQTVVVSWLVMLIALVLSFIVTLIARRGTIARQEERA